MSERRRAVRFKLRTKLFLLFPLLLAIPYMGYQYVNEVEQFLRDGLQASVLGTAQALASSLHDRPELFPANAIIQDTQATGVVYAHPLPAPMEIDGYIADWGRYALERQAIEDAQSSASYVAGVRDDYLYLLIRVKDDTVVYRKPSDGFARVADQVLLALGNDEGVLRRYAIGTLSPGQATAFNLPSRRTDTVKRIEVRIRSQWQPTDEGYVLEVQLPIGMVDSELGLRVVDVGAAPPIATADPFGIAKLRIRTQPLVAPSPEIAALISRLGPFDGRQVWVVDRQGRVLARDGGLERAKPVSPITPLLGLLLRPPSDDLFEHPPVLTHLDGPDIHAALSGEAVTRWRATPEPELWVVSAAHPVWQAQQVVGGIVVEESTLGIQTLTREALANLFNTTVLICLTGAALLLLFASRIVSRLRRLGIETQAAIDEHGRVVGKLSTRHGSDEIGELASSFDNMMSRLREYNSYLEQLARRLSHELRTPLAIVRSSLESWSLDADADKREVYATRAHEGLSRLDAVITRMSEASRLEQALQTADKREFDLSRVVEEAVAGYRSVWPGREFLLRGFDRPHPIVGVPDLVVELLDKLISNAIELGDEERAIKVGLERQADGVRLTVVNHGRVLPPGTKDKLFQSMVSVRDTTASKTTPHLGLGLYVARLIAEFHGARISARDLEDGSGVVIEVWFRDD